VDTHNAVAFPESAVTLQDAYLRGLGAATRDVYKRAIVAFVAFMAPRSWEGATFRDVEAFLAASRHAASTSSKTLSALIGFYGFAVKAEVLTSNPAAAARRPKPTRDLSPRQGLSPVEMRAMIGAARHPRDRALVVALALQGWRISEAVGLRIEDLGEEQGHRVATIRGKGGTVARVPLAAATWEALRVWIDAAGLTRGPVFPGRQAGDALTRQGAWEIVRALARTAGIARKVHPHLFRHGAITTALANDVPLHLVQDFARHADPRTTRRYDSHRQALTNRTPHTLADKILGSKT
jgi:site-specific recombinase XerD